MSNEVVGYIIGAGGVCFAVFSYFTSGVLADKTKIIEHQIKIEDLERRTKDLEEENKKIRNWYTKDTNY